MPVVAVSGLAAEARIARRAGLRTVAAGGDARLTHARLQQLVGEGVTGLVSFGISGGLDPAQACGSLLLPAAVVSETGERHAVDGDWHATLLAALAAAGRSSSTGDTLGAAAIAASASAKAALFRATGAVAVDLESHLVARAAQAASVPFIVLRVIADFGNARSAASGASPARRRRPTGALRRAALPCVGTDATASAAAPGARYEARAGGVGRNDAAARIVLASRVSCLVST